MHDLSSRLAHRVQLTTDGHKPYLTAVEDAFGDDIDYAQLQKIYGHTPNTPETRYSPAQCMGARKAVVSGRPDYEHVSTSHVERSNLSIRTTLLYQMFEVRLNVTGIPLHTRCYAIDVARETVYHAPASHKRLLKNLEAACEMIAMRWEKIEVSVATENVDVADDD